jgi:hypothetical protein
VLGLQGKETMTFRG